MKAIIIIIVAVLAAINGSAQTTHGGSHGKLRKVMAVSACLATGLDLGTTMASAGDARLKEVGVFANHNGTPKLWALSMAKVGPCALGLWMAWHPRGGQTMEAVGISGNAGMTAILGYVGFHNLRVLESKRGQ